MFLLPGNHVAIAPCIYNKKLTHRVDESLHLSQSVSRPSSLPLFKQQICYHMMGTFMFFYLNQLKEKCGLLHLSDLLVSPVVFVSTEFSVNHRGVTFKGS